MKNGNAITSPMEPKAQITSDPLPVWMSALAPRDDPEWNRRRELGVVSLMKPIRLFGFSFGGRTRLEAEKTFEDVYDECMKGNSGSISLGMLHKSRVFKAMCRHAKYDQEQQI